MTYKAQSTEDKVTESVRRTSGTTCRSTSSSTIDTEPGVFTSPMDLEKIRQAYKEILGDLNVFKAHDIEIALSKHLQVSAILDAIEQTALAPRPSHVYFRAILERYVRHAIYTADDAQKERQERRRLRMRAKSRQWSEWYADPDDVD